MRALADLDQPKEMSISLGGIPLRDVHWSEWRRRILYCPATPAWWEDDRIEILFKTPEDIALLKTVGLSADLWSRPITELSTGEQQRAHVARYLAMSPDVLLLDEPSAALDSEATASLESVIRDVARRAAVLLTSHDPEQISRLATRRWRIRDNRLEEAA